MDDEYTRRARKIYSSRGYPGRCQHRVSAGDNPEAEADLDAGHVRAARKHARRATCLDPDSLRASLLLTAVSVLIADHSSDRATLLAITSGVSLDECGGEQGSVDGARDDGPWGRWEGGLGRRRLRAVGGR
uniref:Uncharacterized protein n=1 Tax=Oryza sativa subsp. indica TaxID=39946 RepID=Q0P174_ORYSI|nr:hypothetical protein TQH17P5.5 [Oryza sativa Indica Group]AAZ06232.1 hypothetical protein TQH17P5.5 [Oryza sativa Indica Group]